MTLNEELARWGETPVEETEEILARLLTEELERQRSGRQTRSSSGWDGLPTRPPSTGGDLQERARQLTETGSWIEQFVQSILDWSGLEFAAALAAGDEPAPTPPNPGEPAPFSLAARLARVGRLDWVDATRIAANVGELLAGRHARGEVHGAICPAAILQATLYDEVTLTNPVQPVVDFCAPEVLAGSRLPASDVYGLAATLFALWTGQPPFPRATPRETLEQRSRRIQAGLPTPDPRCVGVPERLELLVRAALACDPARRPTMADFSTALRTALNQLLVDRLPSGATRPGPAVQLKVRVYKEVSPGRLVPVVAQAPAPQTTGILLRDLRRVPPPPPQVELHTGDRVCIDIMADREGYVTVYNIGPRGALNLLHPDDPGRLPPRIQAGQTLRLEDIVLTPPTGQERVFAVWTRQPSTLDRLLTLAAPGTSPGSQATRDLQRVKSSLDQPSTEWHATVLELVHLPVSDH
jgi:hypothetical protein